MKVLLQNRAPDETETGRNRGINVTVTVTVAPPYGTTSDTQVPSPEGSGTQHDSGQWSKMFTHHHTPHLPLTRRVRHTLILWLLTLKPPRPHPRAASAGTNEAALGLNANSTAVLSSTPSGGRVLPCIALIARLSCTD